MKLPAYKSKTILALKFGIEEEEHEKNYIHSYGFESVAGEVVCMAGRPEAPGDYVEKFLSKIYSEMQPVFKFGDCSFFFIGSGYYANFSRPGTAPWEWQVAHKTYFERKYAAFPNYLRQHRLEKAAPLAPARASRL